MLRRFLIENNYEVISARYTKLSIIYLYILLLVEIVRIKAGCLYEEQNVKVQSNNGF